MCLCCIWLLVAENITLMADFGVAFCCSHGRKCGRPPVSWGICCVIKMSHPSRDFIMSYWALLLTSHLCSRKKEPSLLLVRLCPFLWEGRKPLAQNSAHLYWADWCHVSSPRCSGCSGGSSLSWAKPMVLGLRKQGLGNLVRALPDLFCSYFLILSLMLYY